VHHLSCNIHEKEGMGYNRANMKVLIKAYAIWKGIKPLSSINNPALEVNPPYTSHPST
jgi:hypothetical protein